MVRSWLSSCALPMRTWQSASQHCPLCACRWKAAKDIDCEELKRETQELETMLQALEVGFFADAKGKNMSVSVALAHVARLDELWSDTCKRHRRVVVHVSQLMRNVSP